MNDRPFPWTLTGEAERAEIYFAIQQHPRDDLPILPLTNVVTVYPHTDRASSFYVGDALGRARLNRFNLTRLAPR